MTIWLGIYFILLIFIYFINILAPILFYAKPQLQLRKLSLVIRQLPQTL